LPKNIYDEHKKNNQLKPYHRVADIHISKNLTNEDELSGVLNWALDGLKRLMDNKDFSYYKSSMETKEKMQKRESSAIIFVQECLEITSNLEQYEVQEDMYRAYINFCMKSNSALKIESEFKFKRILENHGLSMQMKRIATGRQYRWYFVKIKRDDKNGKI